MLQSNVWDRFFDLRRSGGSNGGSNPSSGLRSRSSLVRRSTRRNNPSTDFSWKAFIVSDDRNYDRQGRPPIGLQNSYDLDAAQHFLADHAEELIVALRPPRR